MPFNTYNDTDKNPQHFAADGDGSALSPAVPHEKVVDLVGITNTGQQNKGSSLPVTIASNQDPLATYPAGIITTGQQNKNGSLPVTLASNQDPVTTYPAGITTPGQQPMTSSLPVTIASDQDPVSVAVQGAKTDVKMQKFTVLTAPEQAFPPTKLDGRQHLIIRVETGGGNLRLSDADGPGSSNYFEIPAGMTLQLAVGDIPLTAVSDTGAVTVYTLEYR